MPKQSNKLIIQNLLEQANIALDGNQPWDIQIHQDRFYSRILQQGTLGLGEAYMDNWWDCERLDVFFERVLKAGLETHIQHHWQTWLKIKIAKIFNLQKMHHASRTIAKHYNMSNPFFQAMLDNRMIYSCGYWPQASTLGEAQEAKLELTCQKLMLQSGMRLLDIGCGWGGLAKYAAEKKGVSVVGITISQEQAQYAEAHCKGLPIDIRLQDYRLLNESFDRIVSIGMFEHVGHHNYRCYMQTVHRCLHDDGLFLLHSIGNNTTIYTTNEWVSKYIFPCGELPSIALIAKAIEGLFVMEDWHNFGADYDKTLMSWYRQFVAHWDDIKSLYDERFFRMWTYYLLSSAGAFRARDIQLWQIVLSKKGMLGGYHAPR